MTTNCPELFVLNVGTFTKLTSKIQQFSFQSRPLPERQFAFGGELGDRERARRLRDARAE